MSTRTTNTDDAVPESLNSRMAETLLRHHNRNGFYLRVVRGVINAEGGIRTETSCPAD
jgi:hypothetical protein